MPAVTVPKRNRRRKRKPKLCFTSRTTRSGLIRLPFNREANFPRLQALFKIPQKAEQEECSKTVFFRTPPKLPNDKPKAKIGSLTLKHLNKKKCEVSSSKSAEAEATFVEDDVTVRDKPLPTPLTQLNVVDIVRQLRKVLQENGPSREDDLLKALCASQAQIIISVYGTISAFLDRFVFYKCTDDRKRHPGRSCCRVILRALQAVRQTCEAEVQTQKRSTARLAEMKSMLQEREKRITELKERLSTTRVRQAREAQQVRDKIELHKVAAPPPPPRRVKEVCLTERLHLYERPSGNPVNIPLVKWPS
ncbi:hypothetical protein HPB52_018664 [Rhipicephalus sanguineus]|uniref:Uncharacterized protein n=1 Tax=Rhipicephalus sanguineus TaxID=34632 RepID=A0A9D4T153_RHISA|nr:hypothetical protein HPB52_018664 [Rhipicephalus sanguineus]